jgi:hypothetical protein
MKFKMLLWYMARRMELLARTHPEFIARLHGRDFTLQISSDEGSVRYYRVRHNRVVSRNAAHSTPSMTLQFASDDMGFDLLSKADPAAFMAAMQSGDVKVSGDFSLLMWFMSIAPFMRPHFRNRQAKKAVV